MPRDEGVEVLLSRDRDSAISALFLAHHRRLIGLAVLLVDDEPTAEDVVQDAFLALYRRWIWMRDPSAAFTYLRTAVVNGSRSQLRHRRVRRRLDSASPRDPDRPSAEATAVERAEYAELLALVSGLPARQRQVLVLRYYQDMSEAEIADTLSISTGSVKQHASRALAALNVRLGAST